MKKENNTITDLYTVLERVAAENKDVRIVVIAPSKLMSEFNQTLPGFSHQAEQVRVEREIKRIFLETGIRNDMRGYGFLVDIIMFLAENRAKFYTCADDAYAQIAEKHHTNVTNIQRTIRHAIDQAWNHGNLSKLDDVLGYKAIDGSRRPTNKSFIAAMVDHICIFADDNYLNGSGNSVKQ